jgi:hypothetical protein
MIAACAAAAGTAESVEVVWMDEKWLHQQEVAFPLHLPTPMGIDGLFRCSPAKAQSHGFANRPIEQTAADTLAWDRTREGDGALPGGPTPEREAELVAAWRSR